MLLVKRIIRAGIPKGWQWKDALISPLKIHEMECPSPHPGQKLNPMFFNGQSDK